ncbi:MAG: hypothetical protein ACI8PD_001561, partial [Nitrospinales bacterium]
SFGTACAYGDMTNRELNLVSSAVFWAYTDWAKTATPKSISKTILLNCFMDLSPS